MTTIWNEDQVTLPNLAKHFEDCGFTDVSLKDDGIHLHTASGLYHRVSINVNKKFLHLGTYLPTDRFRERAEKLELINRFNRQLFLTSFALDDDNDVLIDYPISFETGLIIGQFMILLKRFGSMIDFVVENENAEGSIQIDRYAPPRLPAKNSVPVIGTSEDQDNFKLDESCPADVVLN